MTLSIQQQHAVASVTAFDDSLRASAAALGLAPQVTLAPADGPVAPPLATIGHLQGLQGQFAEALASGDPSVLMAAVATMLRDNQMTTSQAGAQADRTQRRAQCEAQAAAFTQAQQAQQNAGFWNTIAKIGAYVGAGLAAVVGVATAVFSGGTTMLGGIALAAVLVSSAATIGLNLVQDTHLMQGPPPRWFSICVGLVGIVGAIASMGTGAGGLLGVLGNGVNALGIAGNVVADVGVDWHLWNEPPPWFRMITAGTSIAGCTMGAIGNMISNGGTAVAAGTSAAARIANAASAANTAADAVRAAAGTVRGVAAAGEGLAQVAQGVGTIGTSVCTFDADNHRADAKRHQAEVERLGMQMDDLADAMRDAMNRFNRMMQRASTAGQDVATGRMAAIGNLRMA